MANSICSACCVLAAGSGAASAGAFLADQGYGQFIAGIAFSEGTRRFDSGGHAEPVPAYRKALAAGYLEYGLRPWLTFVAAPTLSRAFENASNAVTGSDGSAFGARLLVFGRPNQVVSLQALVQPPLGGSRSSQLATGGDRAFATDLRLQVGQSLALGGWPVFVEMALGARLRADPFPNEARLDLAAGVRPIPDLMLLLQDFSSAAPSRGPSVERTSYSKAQLSAVYDLSARWSLQLGAFRTLAGRNAIRDTGPVFAAWLRF